LGSAGGRGFGKGAEPPSFGEDGVIGAGAAPPIGCRRWRNPLVVLLRTWVCGARARHAWPLHHGAIIK